jgi:hypothetical protein
MLLTDLIHKTVYAGITPKGKCIGIGISLKNHSVKYLLCSSISQCFNRTDFCVSVSAIDEVDDGIYLSHLRPAFPKACAKIVLGLPIYRENGLFVGNLTDATIENGVVTDLITNRQESISLSCLSAVCDAILLRKPRPYPIGQRIPAHAVSTFFDKNEDVVNKTNLRTAIKKGSLIKLTLSLPPFSFNKQNDA